MVIQFKCPGCQQPIEVDPEWGGQHVACPFCHRVVTAPTVSTLRMQDLSAPVARAAAQTQAPPKVAIQSETHGSPRMANAGLACALLAIFFVILSQILIQSVVSNNPSKSSEELQRDLMKLIADEGLWNTLGLPLLTMAAGGIFWILGISLCLVAYRWGHLRARVGLIVSAVLPLMFCLGLFFEMVS